MCSRVDRRNVDGSTYHPEGQTTPEFQRHEGGGVAGRQRRRRHSIAVRRLIQRVGVAGGVVLSSLPLLSQPLVARECACAEKTTLAEALSQPLSLSGPLPRQPTLLLPPVLSRATPLLILLQTGSNPPLPLPPPRTHPRRVSRTPLERYAPMRVYTSPHSRAYCLFVYVTRPLLDACTERGNGQSNGNTEQF